MSGPSSKFEQDLDKTPANFVPLTPLSFIERAAAVYPQRLSVVHGAQRYTWKETYARARRLASALSRRGVGVGDTVAVMLPNTPPMYEAHFGVPMCGAVLNALNTRLDAQAIAFMLEHGEAKLLITDTEFSAVIDKVKPSIPVIDVEDAEFEGGTRLGDMDYEAFLATGDPEFEWRWPEDEWEAIALNYTSGTTGNPKGVVYHHRGAYLNAVCNIVTWSMPAAFGLPVDAADVPLQRLDLPLDDGGQRRDERLPAQGRSAEDLRADQGGEGDALLRRADRPLHADRRARGA